MQKSMQWVAVILALLVGFILSLREAQAGTHDADFGMIVVSPNGPQDGTPFGPGTPGTRTAGIQEALNEAAATEQSVCIRRGIYVLQEPVMVGPLRGCHLEAGQAVLRYVTADRGPVLSIDSQLNARMQLPALEAPNLSDDGSLLLVNPVHPIEGAIRLENCDVQVGQITGHQDGAGHRQATGMQIDSSLGAISANRIRIAAVRETRIGIHLRGTFALQRNLIESLCSRNNHTAALVEHGAFNRMQLNTAAEDLVPSIGVQASGGNDNVFQLTTLRNGHEANGDFRLLQETARSRVIMPQLWNGYIMLGTQNKIQIQEAF